MNDNIKALSLRQPWASLVVEGYKNIETRTWGTNYRGTVLIHASGVWDLNSEQDYKNVKGIKKLVLDILSPEWKLTGRIVGLVKLIECCECIDQDHWVETLGQHLCPLPYYSNGKYLWYFVEPIKFHRLILCKGNLGLWTPGPEILAEVEKQLAEKKLYPFI